jgi:hypothetical protein
MSAPHKLHLEAEIGIIADMADVCDHLACHYADQLIGLQSMNLTGRQAADQAERSSRLLIFVAGHLAYMANQLKNRYLNELEAGPH